MSTYAEQPFTEFEERYFLAEILKKSALPPVALLNIVRESGVEPAWTEIALPNGRSLSSCQQAYQALFARAALPPPQPIDPSRRLKRPFSSLGDATTTLPRELQPRPPSFASINGQQVPIPPLAPLMSPVEPQRKKRGRPTKSEYERRQAEARERGEVWPKPRKAKARPSTEGSESAPGQGPSTTTAAAGAAEGRGGSRPVDRAGSAGGALTAVMYSPGNAPPGLLPRGPVPPTSQRGDPRAPTGPQSEAMMDNLRQQGRLPQSPQGPQPPVQPLPGQGSPMETSFTSSPRSQQFQTFQMEQGQPGPQSQP